MKRAVFADGTPEDAYTGQQWARVAAPWQEYSLGPPPGPLQRYITSPEALRRHLEATAQHHAAHHERERRVAALLRAIIETGDVRDGVARHLTDDDRRRFGC